jgi:two-component SAPR family response regulator
MYQQRILIYMPAPIIGIGLHVQFDNWGFKQIEHVMDVEMAMDSVTRYTPALLVMDADWLNREESFRLIQLVRKECESIPIIFISKYDEQALGGKEQLQWLSPYKWLPKPCQIDDLWQAVVGLLPNIESSSQQG